MPEAGTVVFLEKIYVIKVMKQDIIQRRHLIDQLDLMFN